MFLLKHASVNIKQYGLLKDFAMGLSWSHGFAVLTNRKLLGLLSIVNGVEMYEAQRTQKSLSNQAALNCST